MDVDTKASQRNKKKNNIIKKRGRRREQHQIVMDLFLALILCHNVTPVYTEVEVEEENYDEGGEAYVK